MAISLGIYPTFSDKPGCFGCFGSMSQDMSRPDPDIFKASEIGQPRNLMEVLAQRRALQANLWVDVMGLWWDYESSNILDIFQLFPRRLYSLYQFILIALNMLNIASPHQSSSICWQDVPMDLCVALCQESQLWRRALKLQETSKWCRAASSNVSSHIAGIAGIYLLKVVI